MLRARLRRSAASASTRFLTGGVPEACADLRTLLFVVFGRFAFSVLAVFFAGVFSGSEFAGGVTTARDGAAALFRLPPAGTALFELSTGSAPRFELSTTPASCPLHGCSHTTAPAIATTARTTTLISTVLLFLTAGLATSSCTSTVCCLSTLVKVDDGAVVSARVGS